MINESFSYPRAIMNIEWYNSIFYNTIVIQHNKWSNNQVTLC